MLDQLKLLGEVTGWLVGGGAIVILALVGGWYLPRFRELAVAIAFVAASSTFFLAKGVYLGTNLERARNAVIEAKAVETGVKAHDAAQRDVDAGGVRNDKLDRDNKS